MKEVDVAVIGAGPAGLAAAVEASRARARVLILEESRRIGGRVFGHGNGRGERRPGYLAALWGRLQSDVASLNIPIVHDAAVWNVSDGPTLDVSAPSGSFRVRGQSLVLAGGAVERWIPVPGWTLPGTLGAGGVQSLLRDGGIVPGRRVLVAGTGPLLLSVAAELVGHGIGVAGVVDASPFSRLAAVLPRMARARPTALLTAWSWWWQLLRYRIRVRFGHAVTRIEGEGRVEEVSVARLGRDWAAVAGSEKRIQADTVVLNFGFTPAIGLAGLAGCRIECYGPLETPSVWRDANLQSSVPGFFVCGDGGEVGGALVAEAEGRVAGLAAAAHAVGRQVGETAQARHLARRLRRARRFGGAVSNLYAFPPALYGLVTPDTIVCRCEEVQARRIWEAMDEGAGTLKGLKGLTDCGLGPCQGQVCGPTLAAMLLLRGRRLSPGPFNPRPPARQIPLGYLETL